MPNFHLGAPLKNSFGPPPPLCISSHSSNGSEFNPASCGSLKYRYKIMKKTGGGAHNSGEMPLSVAGKSAVSATRRRRPWRPWPRRSSCGTGGRKARSLKPPTGRAWCESAHKHHDRSHTARAQRGAREARVGNMFTQQDIDTRSCVRKNRRERARTAAVMSTRFPVSVLANVDAL